MCFYTPVITYLYMTATIKTIPQRDRAYYFAVRRLVRAGYITQSAIMKTVGCSKSTANTVLTLIKQHDKHVEQKGQKLCLRETFDIESHPEWSTIASESNLVKAIENNLGMEFTGLTTDELPFKEVAWSSGLPEVPNLMTAISTCLLHLNKSRKDHRAAISIQYVGMKKGEHKKWRTILPLGIERVMGQLRLIAQDLDKEGYPVRNFVISRISAYRTNTRPMPKDLRIQAFEDSKMMVTVELNHELTIDQENAVRTELKLPKDKNTLQINRRVRQDFLRRYSDTSVNGDAIWPVITSIKEGIH